MQDSINLSQDAVDGMSKALDQDFNRVEFPDRMAWIVWLLKLIEDTDEYFPRGKWATIQSIESQLSECAVSALEVK